MQLDETVSQRPFLNGRKTLEMIGTLNFFKTRKKAMGLKQGQSSTAYLCMHLALERANAAKTQLLKIKLIIIIINISEESICFNKTLKKRADESLGNNNNNNRKRRWLKSFTQVRKKKPVHGSPCIHFSRQYWHREDSLAPDHQRGYSSSRWVSNWYEEHGD